MSERLVNVFDLCRGWCVVIFVLMMIVVVVVCVIFGDYGVMWDEWDQCEYGEEVIGWYMLMYGNGEVLDNYNWVYGGFFEIVV